MLVSSTLAAQSCVELEVRNGSSPWDIENSHSGILTLTLMSLIFNTDAPYCFFWIRFTQFIGARSISNCSYEGSGLQIPPTKKLRFSCR